MSERSIVLVIGVVAGALFCCVSSLLLLATTGAPAIEDAAPPPATAIEAVISEDYLNDVFLASAAEVTPDYPITAGGLDVEPGNRLRFAAQVETPAGELTARGLATIAVDDGRLRIRLAELRLGQVPITPFVGLFMPGLEADIDEYANRQLVERAGGAGVELLAVRSDDAGLHFYLDAEE